MPQAHHHVEYPPPTTAGPPSPATSVGSRHPEDATSTSDSEDVLPQPLFELKWADKIGLGQPTEEEIMGNKEPLLPRPPAGSADEKRQFEMVLQNLRKEIHTLGDDVIFQKTLLRGSVAATHEPTLTDDIDAIMNELMSPPSGFGQRPQKTLPTAQCTPGPWSSNETRYGFGAGMDSIPGSGSTMGRRGKGKGKAPTVA
ncbi:hypothetical protein V5O48_007014 [Marasmius crinis-equi]|uniref:Uncharacterized protein n=1 Tax=Marasmius crinis-equi TaxID=585013 RepID=A0ABR3FI37_9AGAR